MKIDFRYEISIDVISTTIRRQTAISMKFSFLLPQNTLVLVCFLINIPANHLDNSVVAHKNFQMAKSLKFSWGGGKLELITIDFQLACHWIWQSVIVLEDTARELLQEASFK